MAASRPWSFAFSHTGLAADAYIALVLVVNSRQASE